MRGAATLRCFLLLGLVAAGVATASDVGTSPSFNATITGPYVKLRWTPPLSNGGAPLVGYQIYRGKVAAPLGTYLKVGVRTTYTDTGVSRGVRYYYRIAARNRIGTGKKSNERSVLVP